MPNSFGNQPRILRGAFVEYGLSVPPLLVVFQFNPEQITRTRTMSVKPTDTAEARGVRSGGLRRKGNPATRRSFRPPGQTITVQQETLGFDIRLDATDKLNQGNKVAEQFGITPQLSTLELMMLPKKESLLGGGIALLRGGLTQKVFNFVDEGRNPPIILFVWGRKKVLPVNITSMTIKEEEFGIHLHPTRAVVSVQLEVIEGANAPFLQTKAQKEAMALLNLTEAGAVTTLLRG